MNFLLIKQLWIHLYIKLDYVRTSSHSCEEKKTHSKNASIFNLIKKMHSKNLRHSQLWVARYQR
jgi:hypothetical protein